MVGQLGGPVHVTGDARSIRVVSDPLALVPALAGAQGQLQVDGSASVTAGRTRFKGTGLMLYANEQYRSEVDLLLFDRPGATWQYHTTYREGRERGEDTTAMSLSQAGASAYDLTSDSAATYADDDVNHFTIDAEGNVLLTGFRWDYGPQEWLEVGFSDAPVFMPELVSVGQTQMATRAFEGSFSLEDDGATYQGDCAGAAALTLKLLGYEAVTVPAGTFLAIQTQVTISIRNADVAVDDHGATYTGRGSITDTSTWWLVPGVGPAQSATSHALSLRVSGVGSRSLKETVTQELTSYDLP
jgi:hypothetical protein